MNIDVNTGAGIGFFLRNFAGFLIQIGPAAALLLIPFSREDFRIPAKWVYAGCGAFAVITSLGFTLIKIITMPASPAQPTLIANMYMLVVIAVITVLYFLVTRVEKVKKVIVLILVVFYAATQFLLVNMASPMIAGAEQPDSYPPVTLALYAVTAAVLFPAAAFMMHSAVKDYLAEIDMKYIRRESLFIVFVTLLYFGVLILCSSASDSVLGNYWWMLTLPFLLTAAVLVIFYWTLFKESVRRRRDNEQQKAMEIQKLQYRKITQEMENTRRMRHDMRHHLTGLYEMLEQERTEEAKSYLSELIGTASRRGNETYCRNTEVNALLQYYAGQAESEKIRCRIQADCGELTVSAADLTVLFGNAMENAIHACREMTENRWINVAVGIVGGTLAIQIKNPCRSVHPSGKYRLDGSFLPAAAFRSLRPDGGYGLKSIEHTARKYGGDAGFQYNEKEQTFTTRIRLNLHPEMLYRGKRQEESDS